MCKRKKRRCGKKNDKNYRIHLSRALRAELIFVFIDLTEASGSFLVALRSKESSSSSDLHKQKSYIGFELFTLKEFNYVPCIKDQWLLVTVHSCNFYRKLITIPQTFINIIESSFTIATVRCILCHLQKDRDFLINFHIHKDNIMRMASESRRRNSLSKDIYQQWNEL